MAADRHRYRAITPRLHDDVHDQFKAATTQQGSSMNAIIVSLVCWWLRIPGAKLPERPPRKPAG